jgi:outer membrane protein OmpA-like peptidoglycan-associated protein
MRRSKPGAPVWSTILFSAILSLAGCADSLPRNDVAAPQPAPTVAPTSAVSATAATAATSPPAPAEAAPAVPADVAPPVLVEENNVFFRVRSALISAEDQEKLKRHAERLKADRRTTVTLVGHTDELGSRSYNLALTEERLSAVSKQLRSYGVSPRQIRRNRSGGVRQHAGCTTDECRDRVRRVELVYSP